MKVVSSFISLIISVFFIALISCFQNTYALKYTLIFSLGLFVGFYFLVVSKKSGLFFWAIALITSCTVYMNVLMERISITSSIYYIWYNGYLKPDISFIVSFLFFISIHIANHFASKSDKWMPNKFLLYAISLGTLVSFIGSISKMISAGLFSFASIHIVIYFIQGLFFSTFLFIVFMNFLSKSGFIDNWEFNIKFLNQRIF